MDREALVALLANDGGEAALAARAALLEGAPFEIWNDEGRAAPANHYAPVYATRLRTTRRMGTPTLGLEEAVERLRTAGQEQVYLGHVDAEAAWTYMVFLAATLDRCIACTGVQGRRS